MATVSNVAILPAATLGDRQNKFSAKDRIDQAITPEIVIALCGPLGTPLHRVSTVLEGLLRDTYRYEHVEVIRLSTFIKHQKNLGEHSSIRELIDAGNELRDEHGHSVLAQLAIRQIANSRQLKNENHSNNKQLQLEGFLGDDPLSTPVSPAPVLRHCHIIDSIKNKEELQLLRAIYGQLLHVVSVYTPLTLRTQDLEKRLTDRGEVYALIDRDSGEEIANGQSVRDIFPLADFFLKVDDGTDDQIRIHLQRYLDLLLGMRVITPTPSERAMYAAHSAARNSACLSRQVGAAIADDQGEVLAVGWNDVPKAFGGLYESSGSPNDTNYVDHRCWNKDGGKCFNDEEKTEISRRLANVLAKEKIITDGQIPEISLKLRKSSELRGLIEFSRAVHAEMHALLNAGHLAGERIRGGKLFVTTFPCHSCARHIIAAGIREVRFIEPYRKSLATRLHPDAITESESDSNKVRIVPFDGVAPARFLDLFSESSLGRKDPSTGRMRLSRTSIPVTSVTLEAITTLEGLAVKELESKSLLK